MADDDKETKKTSDPNTQHYFDVLAKDEHSLFLEDIVNESSEVAIWRQGQSEKELEFFTAKQFDLEEGSITLEKKGTFFQKLMVSELSDCEVFLKAESQKLIYFTNGHLKRDQDKYLFYRDGEIYKSQQRRNFRLDANSHVSIKFILESEVYDGIDASAGGISLGIPLDEVERFSIGSTLSEATLKINREAYIIPRSIVMKNLGLTRSLKGEKMQSVAIQFVDLPKDIEEEIRKQVFFEARGEEIRKKFKIG